MEEEVPWNGLRMERRRSPRESRERLRQVGIRVGTDSKNLFIGQYDKLFEEYWLSPISYLSPYRG